MAISYVGGVVAGRTGNSNSTVDVSLSSGLTGGSDAGVSAGDLVVVTVCTGSAARSSVVAVTAPATYTNLTAQRTTATTYDTNVQVSYKFMPATPDSVVTIPAQGNVADGQAYAVQVFRGVDPTTPMDVTPTYATGSGTNNNPNPLTITPVTTGAWIVVTGGGAAATGTTLYTAGYLTNFLTQNGADTNDGTVGAGYFTGWTSGAYDPAAFGGGSANAANSWGATTIALRPEPVITDQVVGFTLDSISSTTTQVLQHNQTVTGTLDSVTVSTTQALQHNQTLAISFDDVLVAVSQSVSVPVANDQALAITLDSIVTSVTQTSIHNATLAIALDSVTASVTQYKTRSQSIAITLDDVTSSISQAARHPQSLAITLDGVTFDTTQTLRHNQSLSASLDDVAVAVTQSKTGENLQALAVTLDSIAFAAEQVAVHSQSTELILDSIAASVSQTITVPSIYSQELALILDDIQFSANQSSSLVDYLGMVVISLDNGVSVNLGTGVQMPMNGGVTIII